MIDLNEYSRMRPHAALNSGYSAERSRNVLLRTESNEPISDRYLTSEHVASGGRLHEDCCRECDDFKTNEIPVRKRYPGDEILL